MFVRRGRSRAKNEGIYTLCSLVKRPNDAQYNFVFGFDTIETKNTLSLCLARAWCMCLAGGELFSVICISLYRIAVNAEFPSFSLSFALISHDASNDFPCSVCEELSVWNQLLLATDGLDAADAAAAAACGNWKIYSIPSDGIHVYAWL